MEPKIVAEFSICAGEESGMSTNATFLLVEEVDEEKFSIKEEKVGSVSASASASDYVDPSLTRRDENESKMEESVNTSSIEVDKGRKICAHSKNHRKKRKVKVDWTPELHKQFVQAVEQLGLDKAVPSKILELMGTDCLTRHNVASHLQKYRSHQKHLLARESEATSWNRRRQTYGTDGRAGKKDLTSCVPVTGFPPVTSMPYFRPLHVWGHPSTNQSWMYASSKPSPLLPNDSSYWYYHHQDVTAPGVPSVLPHFPPAAFPVPPVPGIPSTSMYRVEPGVGIPTVLSAQALPQPPCDFHLSTECIDTAIGDVLSKPWMPLPLGLKPPSIDSIMAELKRQGISKIHPDLCLTSR